MACTNAQMVLFRPHMLLEETKHRWENTHQTLEETFTTITWNVFKEVFLDKYFPAYVHNHWEIEFLELKQGNMFVADYAYTFKEISRYFPHNNGVDVEGSKYVEFENGMRSEIKQLIGYQEIHHFLVLVNKCVIYGEDNRAMSTHCKSSSEKKVINQNCGNPYLAPSSKGTQSPAVRNETSRGGISFALRSFRSGKTDHSVFDCRNASLTCFNIGEQGHINMYYQRPKREPSIGPYAQRENICFKYC